MPKIKTFIAALEQGKSKQEAIDLSGVAKATANINYSKWMRSKLKLVGEAALAEVPEENEEEDDLEIVQE